LKVKRALIAVIAVTLLSGVYVYQHAKLIEYSYSINSSRENLLLLIDHNRALRYNISRLESPARLEEAIAEKKKTQVYMPLDCYSLKIKEPVAPNCTNMPTVPMIRAGKFMLNMFSFSTEAVADELK